MTINTEKSKINTNFFNSLDILFTIGFNGISFILKFYKKVNAQPINI
jgi:hypothetical protein